MVVQMIAVGEETGALDEMLEKIADFYDREVVGHGRLATSLIEPLLMVFMGVTVGGMVDRALHADVQDHQPREVNGRLQ